MKTLLLTRNNSCQLTQCVLLRCKAWLWSVTVSCSNFSCKQKHAAKISVISDFQYSKTVVTNRWSSDHWWPVRSRRLATAALRDGFGKQENSESPCHMFTLEKWQVQKQYDKQKKINSQDSLIRDQKHGVSPVEFLVFLVIPL